MISIKTSVSDLFKKSPKKYKEALEKLNIKTIEDLLYFFPSRYEDVSEAIPISQIEKGKIVVIYGELSSLRKTLSWKAKKYTIEATLKDFSGSVKIKWFNTPYVYEKLLDAKFIKIQGKATGKTTLYIANPSFEILPSLPEVKEKNFLVPVYPEKKGLKSKWLSSKIKLILEMGVHKTAKDPLPDAILKKYNLPSLSTALFWVHYPKNKKQQEAARKRFAFETVFFIQLKKFLEKEENLKKKTFKIKIDKQKIDKFISSLPYKLTSSQKKAIDDVLKDLQKQYPMQRLIEGDVGSGKTTVAAVASFAVANNPLPGQTSGFLQTAYMTPTEILARQQFYEFISFFEGKFSLYTPKIGLITSSGAWVFPSKLKKEPVKVSKNQLIKWIEEGVVSVVVGTHSLIQDKVNFKALALAIVDEQHRFGVMQRHKLSLKGKLTPHFMSMTATPIPRTLALTMYGDLDLSVIDTMPKGRKKPITKLVKEKDRKKVYKFIEEKIQKERKQAYVICPRIEEPDEKKANSLKVASAEKEYERIKKEIPNANVGLLHGKMTAKEKDEIMKEFEEGKIDILVATSVVEVGVNVPNATMMIIEGAERFGLAQLHQLRGRIRRSSDQPYCFVFSTSGNPEMYKRLKIFEKESDGLKLAEYDLKLRGSGELYGTNQWGVSDIAMEGLQNLKMVEFAREEAKEMIRLGLIDKNPLIKDKLQEQEFVHFE